MTIDIWTACHASIVPCTLSGTLLRIVESQEQIATNRIVRSLEEQAILEEMLETTKPSPPEHSAKLHYLLFSPFRYPPLKHGSRFGTRTEPSLFYGSLDCATVLAEAAYYRFIFWYGMQTPPLTHLNTQHTLFTARYQTARGLKLHMPPFRQYASLLTDRSDYRATQQLGGAMRATGIEAFEFQSARAPTNGLNIALYTSTVLLSKRPQSTQEWLCETNGDAVRFYSQEERTVHHFRYADFTLNGKLPMPSA